MNQLESSYDLEFHVNSNIHKGFIELFKDNNPMHTNPAYAKQHGFPDVIMHGNILNGFLSYFIGEHLALKNVIILSQKIDFHKPFFVEDILNFKAILKDYSEAVGFYEYKFSFRNQSNTRIAKGNIQIKTLDN